LDFSARLWEIGLVDFTQLRDLTQAVSRQEVETWIRSDREANKNQAGSNAAIAYVALFGLANLVEQTQKQIESLSFGILTRPFLRSRLFFDAEDRLYNELSRLDGPEAEKLRLPQEAGGIVADVVGAFTAAKNFFSELGSGPCWDGEDARLVRSLHSQLVLAHYRNEAAVLNAQLASGKWGQVLKLFIEIGGGWIIIWVVLIVLYPYSRSIQSQVFWNDKLRQVIGFGVIDFCLRSVGPLRRRMLAPFHDSLAQGARPDQEATAFFNGIRVRDEHDRDLGRIVDVIPQVAGRLILVGESGLGKTTFLRRLTTIGAKEGRAVCFLDARDCKNGVYKALSSLVEGIVKEEGFLKTLIHTRDLAVVIDGVNEVSLETRASIAEFAKSHLKADIILATQPMLWEAPPGLKQLTISPLSEADLEAFLLCMKDNLPAEAVVTGNAYADAIRSFVEEIRNRPMNDDTRIRDLTILSNPIDLTLVSELLAANERPHPQRLDEQIFERARETWGMVNPDRPFPDIAFFEYCYTQRKSDSRRLSTYGPSYVALACCASERTKAGLGHSPSIEIIVAGDAAEYLASEVVYRYRSRHPIYAMTRRDRAKLRPATDDHDASYR